MYNHSILSKTFRLKMPFQESMIPMNGPLTCGSMKGYLFFMEEVIEQNIQKPVHEFPKPINH